MESRFGGIGTSFVHDCYCYLDSKRQSEKRRGESFNLKSKLKASFSEKQAFTKSFKSRKVGGATYFWTISFTLSKVS